VRYARNPQESNREWTRIRDQWTRMTIAFDAYPGALTLTDGALRKPARVKECVHRTTL